MSNGSSAVIVRRRMRDRRERRDGRFPWWAIALLAIGALGSLALAAGAGTVYGVYQHYAKDYVPIETLIVERQAGITRIYDRTGDTELGVLTNPSAPLLEPVELAEISQFMIDATVSTEDNSFWDHPGVNFRGLARAAWENYLGGGIGTGTGGSSITQQLVKNIYICSNFTDPEDPCVAERTLDRKLREIAYAIELEQDYTKEQILTWYLNQISYADRYIGVQSASEGYFRKDAADLTLGEAAMLSGIPSAPTDFHPRLNCVRDENENCVIEGGRLIVGGSAKARQEDVLDLMARRGWISLEDAEAAKAETLYVYPAASTTQQNAAAFIDNQVEPRLVRMCEAGVLPKAPDTSDCFESVHTAGWKVVTALDWEETKIAQTMIRGAIERGLELGCDCHNAALVTIEPSTGQLVIYAPNRDPSYTSDPRVAGNIDQLVEINQPGSSFKPAVYLSWFHFQNKAPLSIFWDTNPLDLGGTSITNPRGAPGTEGLISARAGLGGSQNVPAVRAAQEAGVDNVIQMAKWLGITTLEQDFDPTFVSHTDVNYGPSIATGGANIRAIDMAYMNATIANMGVMVGLPHYAEYIEDLGDLRNTAFDEGEDYELALKQKLDFQRGHLRLPGTRELDPIVILEVRDSNDDVIYRAPEPERVQVVDPGSVWLLHSIMSDCGARFVIWGCGASNEDRRLDFFANGVEVPAGVKTGTQQGPLSAADTLETWMNGYSRYAATAVWTGNATNELVLDGPAAGFAAANTTLWLYKHWMGEYHEYLVREGVVDSFEGFGSLQPGNVTQAGIKTPTTDRVYADGGGCDQVLSGWIRTDVDYEDPCEEAEIDTRNGLLAGPDTPPEFRETKEFVKLPAWHPELAEKLVEEGEFNIPIAPTEMSSGEVAVAIEGIESGDTIYESTIIRGSVNVEQLDEWVLEYGRGQSPDEWIELGRGEENVNGATLGVLDIEELDDGVYIVRLRADGKVVKGLFTTVLLNVDTTGTPTPTPNPFRRTPTPNPFATRTPTPNPFATPTPTAPPNEQTPPPPPEPELPP